MKEWIKENMIYVMVVGLLLLFSGITVYKNFTSNKSQPPQTERTRPSESDDSSTVEPETVDEKNYRTAKLKLEHPYTESSEEQKQQVAKAFEEAIKAIYQANHLAEFKGTLENHLSMSQDGMIQTLAMAILVNQYKYQSSKLEVTTSDNDDVVQFLIVLTKNGEDNCYFVGNFNTTVHQIQLKNYIGGNIGGTFG
ncbi:TPA: hypothetical protein U9G18_000982 [Streptococcus agalactiae]|uniref:hypothetical protein n=1 Tax=Streptococcus anginosus TaxID=1328 RepID=UPI002ABBFF0C|nr:hypothetical protein [Streptococcus agalactiae]HEN9135910.1 hypothetical protein [Streptococcus agalactiae]HEO4923516.1 hypothetical protein [Streptococcus agalactiae]HEO8335403.1 hypothetical protein [Streptococcus agalactiae]HEP2968780.1 hypothetical protein [Streptococcus pyogenes]